MIYYETVYTYNETRNLLKETKKCRKILYKMKSSNLEI